MTATQIAHLLGPALCAQGIQATIHPQPMPHGYGHKIALRFAGAPLGSLVVYHGKQGRRYTTNELSHPSPLVLDRIAQAWAHIHDHSTPVPEATQVAASPAPSPSLVSSVELWVDGACLQEVDRLRFGWACLIRCDGHEIYRHSSHQIDSTSVSQRNVAAELSAVLHGLEQCRLRGATRVTVYYDYAGIAAWATGQWRARTPWTAAYAQAVQAYPLVITWQKVRAHSGVPLNELVDTLATAAAHASIESYPIPSTEAAPS